MFTQTSAHEAPDIAPDDHVRVLVAEDDPVFSIAAEAKLRKAGFLVTCVSDGAIAKYLLASEPFDAIVTDLDMPFVGGDELIDAVHGAASGNDTPLFVVTANPDQRKQKDCLSRDVRVYMNKPADWAFLINAIAECVAERRKTGGKNV
jgi:CheY-like chemotaxis protein